MLSPENLAARRARLSPEKRALVEQRLRGEAPDQALEPAIPRRAASDVVPLSFGQQRLWFLQQLEPESCAYNEVKLLHIEGELDIDSLARALREVIRRHEVLRTTFHGATPDARQIVHELDAFPVDVPVVDLTPLPATERQARALERAREEARRPFDFSNGPLVRLLLLRTGEHEFVLVHAMHHIVSDGWSMTLFAREAAELYRAFCERRPSPLPDLPLQYGDYACWQREWLVGDVLERQLDYWKRQLSGIPTVLQLPGHRVRLAASTGRSFASELAIPDGLRAALADLCRSQGVTLFMVLLAALDALLHRYTGQEDLVIGTPIAGRTRPELEPLIGFFVNTLPLRTIVAGDLTFLELLRRVRDAAFGAFAHQDLPFERLVEALQPERSLSHTPLFQVMFALENLPDAGAEVPGLRGRLSGVDVGAPKFDLTLLMRDSADGLSGMIEGNADLLDPELIRQLGAHYVTVLTGLVSAPGKRIAEVELLSPAERRRIVVDWNAPRAADAARTTVDRPAFREFESRAESDPDATAVRQGTATLTYAELNRAANRLARGLLGAGAGTGRRVVVLAERSIESIEAMLAVWKVGAVYVPLDPSTPRERLAYILEQTDPAIVLTPPFEHLASGSDRNLDLDVALEQPAYIIYTSGSSGRPKGAVVSHGALAQHCADVIAEYQLTPRDRVLQFSSPMVDMALEQVVPSILAGACVALRPNEPPDPLQFPFELAALGVTVIDLPTAFWRAMLQDADNLRKPADCPALRLVLVGGDAMHWQDAAFDRVFRSPARLLNAYGPTEATVTALLFDVAPGTNDSATIPLGRPIGRRQAIILDRCGNPVPPGAQGELYLGGTGLADGYLNQPARTAEVFVRNPFDGELPGTTLYRTGDLAQYRSDGVIEFLGRSDDQVKIRSYRIELKEIEAILREHPLVGDAAVVLRGDRIGAYVTRAGERAPEVAELRVFLRERLPDYMVPASVTILAALPLTAGGKIDRKALPDPAGDDLQRAVARVAARNQVEAVLAALWADALGIDDPAVDDDFFALGGHSLLATQIIARARDAFGADIPLRWVFETPTIAGLASRIEAKCKGRRLPPVVPADRSRTIPLAVSQEEFWIADRALPGAPFFKIYTAVRLAGAVDQMALARAFTMLIQRHEALRTTFATVDGRPAQIVNPPGPFTLEVFDLEFFPPSQRDATLALLIRDFAWHRFDLEHGPLMRGGLVSLNAAEHVVILTVHHIVCDGWSREIMDRELTLLYRLCAERAAVTLPELPVQYPDFAFWQTAAVASGLLDDQLTYWTSALQGELVPLSLPADHPPPEMRSFRYGRERIELPPALERALAETGRRNSATVFMAMLAGFKALVAGLTGQTDIRVGTIAANRNSSEVEHVIGLFINTLVLRTDVSGDPSFDDLLVRVRAITLDAFDHQEVPFERVHEAVRLGGGSLEALFQILFLFDSPRLRPEGIRGIDTIGRIASSEGLDVQFSALDWIVEVTQERAGLTVQIMYDADRYRPATIGSVLKKFAALLELAAAEPHLPLSRLRARAFSAGEGAALA